MAEPKTRLNDASAADFINAIQDDQIRQDCWTIINLIQAAVKAPPQMWGSSIVGFGSYSNGGDQKGNWPILAFSPRKQNLTLYGLTSSAEYEELHTQLGKHTSGKGCLYIKRLSDVDLPTLEKLIRASFEHKMKSISPA